MSLTCHKFKSGNVYTVQSLIITWIGTGKLSFNDYSPFLLRLEEDGPSVWSQQSPASVICDSLEPLNIHKNN